MTALFLETCSERALLFFFDQKVLFARELPVGLDNSKYIFPALQAGIKELGVILKELSFIAVGVGPGSYTGIRVGVSVAKGLAYACNVPLIGIPSLACFVPDIEGPFAVLIDAKIRGVYLMTGILANGSICYTSESQVLPLEALESTLLGVVSIVTPNASRLRAKVLSLYPHLSCQWKECFPSPHQMAAWASEHFQEQTSTDAALDLLYFG